MPSILIPDRLDWVRQSRARASASSASGAARQHLEHALGRLACPERVQRSRSLISARVREMLATTRTPGYAIYLTEPLSEQLERLARIYDVAPKILAAALIREAALAQAADAAAGKPPTSEPNGSSAPRDMLAEQIDKVFDGAGLGRARDEQVAMARAIWPFVEHAAQPRLASRTPAEPAPEQWRSPVLFVEAGTGVGKTFMELLACAKAVRAEPGSVAVLAMPTYELLRQALASYAALGPGLGAAAVPARLLLSQQAFVSEQALAAWVSDGPGQGDEARDSVLAWLARSGPAGEGAPSSAAWQLEALLQFVEARCGRDLRADSRDFDLSARLDDDDAGYRSYKAQQPQALAAEPGTILLMTHAMLATWVRSSRMDVCREFGHHARSARSAMGQSSATERETPIVSALNDSLTQALARAGAHDDEPGCAAPGRISLLVVDEAHMLDQAFSAVLSHDVSVWSLLRDLNELSGRAPRTLAKASIARLREAFVQSSQGAGGGAQTTTEQALTPLDAELIESIWQTVESIGKMPSRLAAAPLGRRLAALQTWVRAARTLSAGSIISLLERSPRRRWPRLRIGRRSVMAELDWLWGMSTRSIAASATLYEHLPMPSIHTMQRRLGVRFACVHQTPPIQPRWLFEPVTVHWPEPSERGDGTAWLMRPSSDAAAPGPAAALRALPQMPDTPDAPDEVDEQCLEDADAQHARWAEEVGGYIVQAWRSAAGGMAVLLTAYRDVDAIERVVRAAEPQMALFVQRPGLGVRRVRQAFVASRSAGARPVMMVLGAGWTGFDVNVPGDPNAMTDVVMPVFPVGAHRSLAQIARDVRGPGERAGASVPELAAAAAFLARQGCGRLTRAPRSPRHHNLRLHLLDPRLRMPRFAGLTSAFTRWLLASYPRVQSFTPEKLGVMPAALTEL